MNAKQLIIAGSGTAAVGGAIYYFIHKARQQNEFNELMLILEENKAENAGDLAYLNAFTPNYQNSSLGGKKILLYTAAKVEQLVDALHEAFQNKVFQLSGTDEEAIYAIYRGIESQRKMAQLATRYPVKYGENLLDRLKAELNNNERTKLFTIVKTKPDYQLA